MISLREEVIVRLEIDFKLIAGELGVFHQNAVDLPLEKLIAIWGDQIERSHLMVLLQKLRGNHASQDNRRKEKGLGRATTKLESDPTSG